jgi:hypothetical protein
MKLCSLQLFIWNHIVKTSNVETPKMEVVGLRKLWIFVVDNFLIWIRLEPKKNNLHLLILTF